MAQQYDDIYVFGFGATVNSELAEVELDNGGQTQSKANGEI